ncbi:MAG: hypothetical protein AAB389_04995 [Patescibacteria group bacterium]
MLVFCVVLAVTAFMLAGAVIGSGYDPKAAAEKDERWLRGLHSRVSASQSWWDNR